MAKIKKRYAIVLLLLVFTTLIVKDLQGNYSKTEDSGLEDLESIPMRIDSRWQGQDFPLEEMVYDILETRAIIHRSFKNTNGDSVFLSIVHYADTKVDFHAPEACLGGQGIKTIKTTITTDILSSADIKKITIAKVMTTRSTGHSLSYYFYKSGKYIGSNYIKMRLSIAANKLMNNDTRGSLIRISTTLEPGKENEAESLLVQFTQDLFPYITSAL